MHAIFGIINKSGAPLHDIIVDKLSHSMQHRAFDGMDVWRNGAIALGQCQVTSGLEPAEKRCPPAYCSIFITADIRIDNRQELIHILRLDKHTADFNLLLHAYLKWGEDCVNHLQGEFAFCIWDKLRKRLFLATDHIGYRPLFYYDSTTVFIFCSEIKGILSVKPGPHHFNAASLIEYHCRDGNPDQTYDKDIKALRGGNSLILQDGVSHIKKYWHLLPLNKYRFRKDEEWTECLKELLQRSVENRLRTNKPVGVMLSGGIDSTAITCMLAKILADKNQPLYAFSSVLPISYTGAAQDERKYIDIVRKHCPNLEQTYVETTGDGPFTGIEQAFEADECFPNIFFNMDRAIAAAAKEKKIGTFFIGYGGDYWVSWKGNTVFYQLVQTGHWKEAVQLLKKFNRNGKHWLQLLKEEYAIHTSLYQKIRQVIKRHDQDKHTTLHKEFTTPYHTGPFFQRVQPINTSMQQIISSGRWSMLLGTFANRYAGHEMQSAIPLTDKSINEFMMDVPLKLFRKGGYKRSLMRHAMEGVIPPEIQWRQDKGKYVPDYAVRIMEQKSYIENIMQSEEHNFAFNHFLSRKGIQNSLEAVAGKTHFNTGEEQIISSLAQATISAQLLFTLKEKGYNFS